MQLLVAALLVCVLPESSGRPVDFVKLDQHQAKKVAVVRQEVSLDGRTFSVTFHPKEEQFTADFALGLTDFQKVVITVQNTKGWDNIRYFPNIKRGKMFANLTDSRGVSVYRSGKDTVIEFTTPDAAKILPPGGRLSFRKAFESTVQASR